MKASEVLGWIQKHDELQAARAGLQTGLAARQVEEARLAAAWSRAAQGLREAEDRIGSLRAMGDAEGAAALDLETHGTRKAAKAADAALTKHREATREIHGRIVELQTNAETLARTITASLSGVEDRAVLGGIAGRLTDIGKSANEAVERNWQPIEAELHELRPLVGWWERVNNRANPWVQAIASGRSATARRCLDEGVGVPAGEVVGRRKR